MQSTQDLLKICNVNRDEIICCGISGHSLGMERPEDIYGAVVFLASDAANYVTDHDLIVDGGHTLNAWLAPLGRDIPPRISLDEETVQMKG